MHWRCPPVLVQVLVKTSDIKGAGTDANVYLTLFGDWVRGQLLLSPYSVCTDNLHPDNLLAGLFHDSCGLFFLFLWKQLW